MWDTKFDNSVLRTVYKICNTECRVSRISFTKMNEKLFFAHGLTNFENFEKHARNGLNK